MQKKISPSVPSPLLLWQVQPSFLVLILADDGQLVPVGHLSAHSSALEDATVNHSF